MTDGGFIRITPTEKRDGIPNMGEGRPCDQQGCPGPEGWQCGFGLAGGGYGAYSFCEKCERITEKTCYEEDEENGNG